MKRPTMIRPSEARLAYICHPLTGDIPGNIKRVEQICSILTKRILVRCMDKPKPCSIAFQVSEIFLSICDYVPIAPHMMFPTFLDDDAINERNLAMDWCLSLLRSCSELWVMGRYISEGMREEIAYAYTKGIPIRWFEVEDFGLEEVNAATLKPRRTGMNDA